MDENLDSTQGADLLSSILGRLPGAGDLDEFVDFEIYFDGTRQATEAGTAVPYLRARLCEAFELLAEELNRYLWHRDRFVLEVCLAEDSKEQESHLAGHMRTGDGAEDEWFVVHLLRHLTAVRGDVSCRVFDGDGELILIEAALATPRWITPANAEYRCWFRGGLVHLLPRPRPPEPETILCPKALERLRDARGATAAKEKVQDAITQRLEGYPKRAVELSRHMVRAVVPVRVARLLLAYPQLVAVACDNLPPPPAQELKRLRRELEERKGVEAGVRLGCDDEAEQTVCVGVRMTRCQYARVAGLKCRLPQRFTEKHWRRPPDGAMDERAMHLGATLCCGLEAAYLQGPTSATAALGWPDVRLAIAAELLPATVPWWPDVAFASYATRLRVPLTPSSVGARIAFAQQDGIDDPFQRAFTQALCSEGVSKIDLAAHWLDSDDSDAFLHVSAEELDNELEARQAEYDAYDRRSEKRPPGADGVGGEAAGQTSDPEELKKRLAAMGNEISGLLSRASTVDGVVADPGDFAARVARPGEAADDSGSESDDPGGVNDPLGMEEGDDDEDSSGDDEGTTDLGRIREYMAELDEQLDGALDSDLPAAGLPAAGEDFPLSSRHVKVHGAEALDLDVHAMENILASLCSEQQLDPGPASLLLGQLGLGKSQRGGGFAAASAACGPMLDGMD